MAGFERPPLTFSASGIVWLIILKIVTENVIFVDYQSKNVFRKNKHHNALAELDGHGQAEPF